MHGRDQRRFQDEDGHGTVDASPVDQEQATAASARVLWLLCAANLLSMAVTAQGEMPGLGHPTPARADGSQVFIPADGAYQFQGWAPTWHGGRTW
jgi:hypothetical protein